MDSEGFYQASSLVIYNLKIDADAHSCFDIFGQWIFDFKEQPIECSKSIHSDNETQFGELK